MRKCLPSRMAGPEAYQCLKCLMPVKTIAILFSSAALMHSSSRMEPPGCMIAVMPALAARSIESRNGKKASEDRTSA